MKTAVTSFHHGNPITMNDTTQEWHYDVTGENIRDVPVPPCPVCKMLPTKDGHDACIANLPGVKFACCGHGVTGYGYISFEDGRSFKVDGMNEFVVAEDGTTTYPLGNNDNED
jgi:hypothetical protein